MVTKKTTKETTPPKKTVKLEQTVYMLNFILREVEEKHNKLEQKVNSIENAAKMVMSRMGLQGEYREQ